MTPESIVIRPLEDADHNAWEELFRAYIRFYEAQVADDVIALAWQRLLAQEDGFLALIAVDDSGRLLGLAHALFHRSTWSATYYCYLEDLFVAPAAPGGRASAARSSRLSTPRPTSVAPRAPTGRRWATTPPRGGSTTDSQL